MFVGVKLSREAPLSIKLSTDILTIPTRDTPGHQKRLHFHSMLAWLDFWLAFLYLRCESVTVVNVMPPPGQIYNNNNNRGQPPPLPCHLCSQSLSTTFISLPTFNVPQDEEKLGTLDSIINLKNFQLPSEFR